MALAGSDQAYEAAVQKIRKIDPEFGIIEHEESARQQLKVLDKITVADSGSLVEWNGKKVGSTIFFGIHYRSNMEASTVCLVGLYFFIRVTYVNKA